VGMSSRMDGGQFHPGTGTGTGGAGMIFIRPFSQFRLQITGPGGLKTDQARRVPVPVPVPVPE
jgi:hypothetical protein